MYWSSLPRVFALMSLLMAMPGYEQTHQEAVLCATHWPPFTIVENEQVVGSISLDIHREAFVRLQQPMRIEYLQWSRCLQAVREGRRTAAIDLVATAASLHGSVSSSYYPQYLYTDRERNVKPFDWQDFSGVPVGMVRGYTYTEKICLQRQWQEDYANDDDTVVRKLLIDRYRYALLDPFVADVISQQRGIRLFRLEPMVDVEPLYLDFAPKEKALMLAHQRVLQQ
ncbi:substrate-binding periplasmic protein [Permianibacter aggregans]|uniref:Amino acid ABC transporter substrate-binding protein (PAAT family) n=1 Tax=Permianibacter aggregans TaxID=1510150 RepID=A0A4R6UUY6_9GAMM|nr:transporter substrate-binding domain-containing protein [Permianibacter aggregans]QGX39516.1 transporter substrate-binding domain-containing protein [Permianibacter aggregans]TDQ49739.1 amino acid ABC transporter substrate-binding protein (PAAT family) [Permianibacter aggregans]